MDFFRNPRVRLGLREQPNIWEAGEDKPEMRTKRLTRRGFLATTAGASFGGIVSPAFPVKVAAKNNAGSRLPLGHDRSEERRVGKEWKDREQPRYRTKKQ